MSTDRDVARIVRSWLDEGVSVLPARVLDAVLDQVPATHQRRASWPAWRIPLMKNTLRLALAAAVVVIVAFIGYQFLPSSNTGGPGSSPTPSPEPTATPSPTPAAFVNPPTGPLAIGRYTMTVGDVGDLPISVSVSTTGWAINQYGDLYKGTDPDIPGPAQLVFWSPVNVYSDSCAHTPLSPPPGPLAADLAAAISMVFGTDATAPSDAVIGGRAATHVVLAVPEDIACDRTSFYLWYNECGAVAARDPEGCYRYPTALGDTIKVWIVDVDGTRLFIQAEILKDAGPEVDQEVQDLVDSIQFE